MRIANQVVLKVALFTIMVCTSSCTFTRTIEKSIPVMGDIKRAQEIVLRVNDEHLFDSIRTVVPDIDEKILKTLSFQYTRMKNIRIFEDDTITISVDIKMQTSGNQKRDKQIIEYLEGRIEKASNSLKCCQII